MGDAMKPTPFAEEMGDSVLEIVSVVQHRLLTQASFNPMSSTRVFRLCMMYKRELVFLPRRFSELQKVAPHCRIRTSQLPTEHIANSLERGDTDLTI